MTEQEVKDLIEAFIVANGVNAITADVLRPILIAMLTQPNDEIGDLTQLNTVTQDNLVDAINEIYNSISSITNDGIKLYQGDANPNVEPPDSYNIADFYFEEGNDLWQFNGTEWVRANSIFLQNSGYKETKFPYIGSLNFTIPENVQAIIVKKNGNPTENKENWTQLGNIVTYLGTMESGDYLLITGVYVIPSGGGGGFIPTLNDVTSQGSYTSVTIQSPDAVNANDLVNLGGIKKLLNKNSSPVIAFNQVLVDDVPNIILSATPLAWDDKIREIGNYFIDDDGTHYQLYTGYNGAIGVNSRPGIYRSLDKGVTFQKYGINGDGKMFDSPSEDPYLLKHEGIYYLYSEESTNNPKKVQLHTSTDLLNWEDRGIIITYENSTDWDGSSIGSPTPIVKDGIIYVFYEGLNSPYSQYGQLGLAKSTDGINYVKEVNPVAVSKDFNLKFPANALSKETILWGSTVIPDDIIEKNGIFIMSCHTGTNAVGNGDFKASLIYSEDLINWTDYINDFVESPYPGFVFNSFNNTLKAHYIINSETLISANVGFKSDYNLRDKSLSVGGKITSNGELESNGVATFNNVLKANLKRFSDDEEAYNGGVSFNEFYIDNFNVVKKRTTVFNLFNDSEPVDSTSFSNNSSVTFSLFDWGGFNGFSTAANFDGAASLYLMPLTTGVEYNLSFYVKMEDGLKPNLFQLSSSPVSDFTLLIGNATTTVPLTIEDCGDGIFRISGYATKGTSNVTGLRKGVLNTSKKFKVTGFQITKGKYVEPYKKTPNSLLIPKKEIINTAQTVAYTKLTINADYPFAKSKQIVICPNITTGGIVYQKYDEVSNDWVVILAPKLT